MNIPNCPFCGGKPKKSKHSDNVTCECLKPSNTWIPLSIWIKRSKSLDKVENN